VVEIGQSKPQLTLVIPQSFEENCPWLVSIKKEQDSVLDNFLTFTYHTQAFATGTTAVAERNVSRQSVEVRSIFS
jgi:hypothetical protein